ncbi:hypothetical protein [Rhodospirillum rubrum]|uniref:hypothetical protein n=1 Tax=Rhodospirillum rubrum TaxID=1085 RepID=UPI001905B814|nr:hypothetical protein [Rhodospirillum rubrum]
MIDLDFGLALCAAAINIPVELESPGEPQERVRIKPKKRDFLLKSLADAVTDFEQKRRHFLLSIFE